MYVVQTMIPTLTPAISAKGGGSGIKESFHVNFRFGNTAAFNVVRASIATVTNSSGILTTVGNNIPRLDHTYNGTSWESVGLLFEGRAATNLCLQSEDISTTWTNGNSTETTNVAVAPDGLTTADEIIEDATSTVTHYIRQAITTTAAVHSFSAYAKANTRSWIVMGNDVGGGSVATNGVYFDLGSGVVGTVGSSAQALMYNVGNGWYRCVVIHTETAASQNFDIALASGDGGIIYSGDEASGAYVWGAQLELGAPSSYIKTTTGTVARAADVITNTN